MGENQTRQDGSKPSLRIFMSYGHDRYMALAERLVQDLQKRGYQVWFDKADEKAGRNWQTQIEEGLAWVAQDPAQGRFLLLLTPHSVRDPGYCLNELEEALHLHVSVLPILLIDVKLPLAINLHHYIDMRDCVEAEDAQAHYRQKFDRLCHELETLAMLNHGQDGRLLRALIPPWYSRERHHHTSHFTGRQWVVQAIEQWLADPQASPGFLILGPPGAGKSALAVWLSEQRQDVAALHVCGHTEKAEADPRQVVRSVAWQLSRALPEMATHLLAMDGIETFCEEKSADELLQRLIIQVVRSIEAPAQPCLVILDGIDAANEGAVNPLTDILCQLQHGSLPSWLRLLVTSEPSGVATGRLSAWPTLDLLGPQNDADADAYIQRHIAPACPGGALSTEQHQRLLEVSEGNWLYLESLAEGVRSGHVDLSTPTSLPRGLVGAFHEEFRRRFTDPVHYQRHLGPCLAILAAAQESLQRADLARLLKLSVSALEARLSEFGALLHVSPHEVKPYHHALIDWLVADADKGPFAVALADGHRALAQDGIEQLRQSSNGLTPYVRRHLPKHLHGASLQSDLKFCITDARFIACATESHQVFELTPYWTRWPVDALRAACTASLNDLAQRNASGRTLFHAAKGIGQLLQHAGDHQGALEFLQRACSLAESGLDAGLRAHAEVTLAWCLRHAEHYEQAMEHALVAKALYEDLGTLEGEARAHSVIGMCHWHLHDDEAAVSHLQKAVQLYGLTHDESGKAEAHNNLGIVFRSVGQFERAFEQLNLAEAGYRRVNDEKGLGKCFNSQGTALWWQGDVPGACARYRQASRINRRIGQVYVRSLTANNLGYILLERGRPAMALKAFRYARAIRRKLQDKRYEMMDLSGMARAAWDLGLVEQAQRWSQQALAGLPQGLEVEDAERVYLNHFVIFSQGTQAQQQEAQAALSKAHDFVEARASRIQDAGRRARFKQAAPPVREVLRWRQQPLDERLNPGLTPRLPAPPEPPAPASSGPGLPRR